MTNQTSNGPGQDQCVIQSQRLHLIDEVVGTWSSMDSLGGFGVQWSLPGTIRSRHIPLTPKG